MSSTTQVVLPTSQATVSVKAFDIAVGSTVPAAMFIGPNIPGFETMHAPVYAFLIEHRATGKRFMFDLGARKDPENYPPVMRTRIQNAGLNIYVEKDAADQLTEGGVDLKTIDGVIWSHTHFDHTGDLSTFPSSTQLYIGPGSDRRTYPGDPEAILLDTDFTGRTVNEFSFTESTLDIGGLPAIDFFKDGSLYILDVPGHCPGHIAALARVKPNSFVLLAGDSFHHPGMIRPNEHIHANYPCPAELLESTRKSISTKYFPLPIHTDGSGDFDLGARNTPLLTVPEGPSAYADREVSIRSQKILGHLFDVHPDIFIVIAHDFSLEETIQLFPESLDDWKEKGWKEKSIWEFLKDERFKGAKEEARL